MSSDAINNQELLRISKIAITRLARFSSVAEQKISQTFLCKADHFCGIRFAVGTFRAQWMFGQESIEFSRGDQIVDLVSLSETGVNQRAA